MNKQLPHTITLYHDKAKHNHTLKFSLNTVEIGDKTIPAQLYIQARNIIFVSLLQQAHIIQHNAHSLIYQRTIKFTLSLPPTSPKAHIPKPKGKSLHDHSGRPLRYTYINSQHHTPWLPHTTTTICYTMKNEVRLGITRYISQDLVHYNTTKLSQDSYSIEKCRLFPRDN